MICHVEDFIQGDLNMKIVLSAYRSWFGACFIWGEHLPNHWFCILFLVYDTFCYLSCPQGSPILLNPKKEGSPILLVCSELKTRFCSNWNPQFYIKTSIFVKHDKTRERVRQNLFLTWCLLYFAWMHYFRGQMYMVTS